MDITLAREQTIADMYNSAGGIGKEYRGPQLCEKKDFFPRRLHRSHLQLYPRYVRAIVDARPSRCYRRQRRNRFKISLNTNASHQCVRDVERLKFVIIFVLRRESDINLAKINGK